ncbi:hypothetical protein [Cupriavidus necator]
MPVSDRLSGFLLRRAARRETYGTIRAEYDIAPAWTTYVGLGAHHANEFGNYGGATVNGSFKAAQQRYTLRAAVENVANKAYRASACGGYLVQGAPRTFTLSMTVDF